MPSPILIATLQSTLITLCSCLFATLFTPTPPPLLPLLVFTLLSTPPNYLWQQNLERLFPGHHHQKPDLLDIDLDDDDDDDDAGEKKPRNKNKKLNMMKMEKEGRGKTRGRLNVRNTAVKLGLDQTLGAVVNIVAFLGGVRLLRGAGWGEAVRVVREQTWPLMLAGYKLWPAVSLLCFTVVPVERRTLVGSLVGFVWGVFLALRAAE